MDSKWFILGLCEDRCKDSKGIDGILKDLYKDSSWISIGFPSGFKGGMQHFWTDSIRIHKDSMRNSMWILLVSLSGFWRISTRLLQGL